MKNQTLKNLIGLGALVMFLAGYNAAHALTPYTPYMDMGPSQDYYQYSQPQYQPQYSAQNQQPQYGTQYQPQFAGQYQPQYQAQPVYAQMYAPRPEYTELPTWTPTHYRTASSNGAPVQLDASPTIAALTQTTTPTRTVATKTTTTKNTVIAKNTTPTNATSNQTTTTDSSSTAYSPYGANSNQLTALSVRGSGGFMPSSVWQWLIVIFLILVIIIIARVLGRKPSHHDVHHVAAH